MDRMVRHEGVTSFKLFMAYPGVFMVDDATIFKAMLKTRENGGLICMHAENGGVIDTLVKEALRKGRTRAEVSRADAADARGRRSDRAAPSRSRKWPACPIYIVHLSCADALEKVKQARDMGLPAYAETCPQYLFLSYDDYEREGFEGAKFVMSPPLREKWHQDVLWKGILKNDLQVVSTDHCPFCMNEPPQKQIGADDFSKIPERRAGDRDAPDAAVGRRRPRRAHRHAPLRRDRVGESRHGCSACGRGRERLRSAPTAIWWSGIRIAP